MHEGFPPAHLKDTNLKAFVEHFPLILQQDYIIVEGMSEWEIREHVALSRACLNVSLP